MCSLNHIHNSLFFITRGYSWNVNPTNSKGLIVYTCTSTGSRRSKDLSCYPVSELHRKEKYTSRYEMVVMSRKSHQISSEAACLASTTMFATSKVSEILFLCCSDAGISMSARRLLPHSHTEYAPCFCCVIGW